MCQYCNNTGLCYVLLTLISYKMYRVVKPWVIAKIFSPIRAALRGDVFPLKIHE